MRRNRNFAVPVFATVPLALLLAAFWLPIAVWIGRRGTLSAVAAALGDGVVIRTIALTALVAAATAVLATGAGLVLALLWWLTRRDFIARCILALAILPLSVSLLARNFGWMALGSLLSAPNALAILRPIVGLYTFHGVLLVMTYIFVPIATVVLTDGLRDLSSSQLSAGRTLGATDDELFKRLVLPALATHIRAASIYIFASALGYYITPFMIGGGRYDLVGNLVVRYANDLGDFTRASAAALALVVYLCGFYFVAVFVGLRHRINRYGH